MAFGNFYRKIKEKRYGKTIKAGFPRFKSSDRYIFITHTQSGFRIMDNGHVWFSKIGKRRRFIHRSVTGHRGTVSVKHDSAGEWFITFTSVPETGNSLR